MRNNSTAALGGQKVRTTMAAELESFDALAPDLRTLLNHLPVKIASGPVLAAQRRQGVGKTIRDVVGHIENYFPGFSLT